MTNKEVVKEVMEAFMSGDTEKALVHMTEDIQMTWPGQFGLDRGKEAIREFMKRVPEILDTNVDALIEEGNKVAGKGYIISKTEDGKTMRSDFFDLYELEKGKVKSIQSYVVFGK